MTCTLDFQLLYKIKKKEEIEKACLSIKYISKFHVLYIFQFINL